jgi:hypothetical protein
MLCTSCLNKPNCLAAQLAQGDATLSHLLGQLKHCSLKPRRRTPWQHLTTFWQSLRGMLWNYLRPWVSPNG